MDSLSTTKGLPKMNEMFQAGKREAVQMWILRSRFGDGADKRVLIKRRDDYIKDMNMNLLKGKVIRSSHYFEEISYPEQMGIIKALEEEPGTREDISCKLLEPYIRSMSFFKPYQEFEPSDFQSVCQDLKLHKVHKGTRLGSYGDPSDTVYLIMKGRVAITHPNKAYFKVKEESTTKQFRERTELMTQRQVEKQIKQKTFLTAQGLVAGTDEAIEQMKNQRVEDAKTKNKTFQMFDKMLGIEKDPKLAQIRLANPMNNICIPNGGIDDVDERINMYYIPVDSNSNTIHPLLTLSKGKNSTIKNRPALIQTSTHGDDASMSRHDSPRSPRKSRRSGESPGSRDERDSFRSSIDSFGGDRPELTADEVLNSATSPGLLAADGFDIQLLRDKQDDFALLETVISAVVNGCVFGKLCLSNSKEPRTWLYNAIALTDTFIVSLNKNDVFKMVENQRRRILNDQMNFLKLIPSPEFTLLSKKKLQNICEALTIFTCIKGTIIFNQDDALKYIYIVKEGQFGSQVRLTINQKL